MTVPSPSWPAIAVTGLRKAYGEQIVLDGIDLEICCGHNLLAARAQRRGQDGGRPDSDDTYACRRR
jgi:hypothetical protein